MVKQECTESLDMYQSIPQNHRRMAEITAPMMIEPGDCPKGYYSWDVEKQSECPGLEDPSEGYCSAVQMCAPCAKAMSPEVAVRDFLCVLWQGFFSSQLNTACINCPNGAASEFASFGIRQCSCAEGEYIENWQYSKSPFIPPDDPGSAKVLRFAQCYPCDPCLCAFDGVSDMSRRRRMLSCRYLCVPIPRRGLLAARLPILV